MTSKIEAEELEVLAEQDEAKYVEGSLLKHILHASFTASIGLLGIFLVDAADIWFLSLLEKVEITASMSFVGSLGAFLVCISLALNLAASIIISKYIGAKQFNKAKEVGVSLVIYGTTLTILYCIALYFMLPIILDMIGASGKNKEAALTYLIIFTLTMPFLNIGIMIGSILRSFGNFRASTIIMIAASIVNVILDPIFIFTLEMEVKGAAIASLLARIVAVFIGLYYLHHNLKGLILPSFKVFKNEFRGFLFYAIPAMIAFVALPTGSIFVAKILSQYGDEVLTVFAILVRMWVIFFVGIFALEMVLSPIYGQNMGAGKYHRLQQITLNAMIFSAIYVIVFSTLIMIFRDTVSDVFLLKGEARVFMDFMLTYIVWIMIFDASIIISVACLNSIGKPKLASILSWCVALLGIVPGAYIGSYYGDEYGVMIGEAAGYFIFGMIILLTSVYYTNKVIKTNTS